MSPYFSFPLVQQENEPSNYFEGGYMQEPYPIMPQQPNHGSSWGEQVPAYMPQNQHYAAAPTYPQGFGYPYPEEYVDDLPQGEVLALQEPAMMSDPPPILSNPPPRVNIALYKELTGYPNYGNPSGNADILYTGNQGAWTFDLPFNPVPGPQLAAQILVRAVLDDHNAVPTRNYSAQIRINNSIVFSGILNLQHGTPPGAKFNNWKTLTFNIPNLRRQNRVVIVNTSRTNPDDWIALDWMELRVLPR